MADYTQTTFFGPKDALASGNPAKLIKGTEFDTEFSAIQTSLATKYDADDVASNADADAATSDAKVMTPLKVKRLIENATYSGIAKLGSANTFTVKFTVSSANPGIWFNETDAAANNRLWDWNVQGEQLQGRVINDAINASANWVTVDRTDNTVDTIAFSATSLTMNGNAILDTVSGLNASNLNSGTIPDARFPATLPAAIGTNLTQLSATNLTQGTIPDGRVGASSVTQHQASILAGSAKVPVSTTSGTLVAADAWKCVDITADIAVPNSTFTAGDIVTIYNNSSTAKNITRAAGTQYKAGVDGDDASISVAPRGFATIRFRTATEWTISGNVS